VQSTRKENSSRKGARMAGNFNYRSGGTPRGKRTGNGGRYGPRNYQAAARKGNNTVQRQLSRKTIGRSGRNIISLTGKIRKGCRSVDVQLCMKEKDLAGIIGIEKGGGWGKKMG